MVNTLKINTIPSMTFCHTGFPKSGMYFIFPIVFTLVTFQYSVATCFLVTAYPSKVGVWFSAPFVFGFFLRTQLIIVRGKLRNFAETTDTLGNCFLA